jgi:hypothetical protein
MSEMQAYEAQSKVPIPNLQLPRLKLIRLVFPWRDM